MSQERDSLRAQLEQLQYDIVHKDKSHMVQMLSI